MPTLTPPSSATPANSRAGLIEFPCSSCGSRLEVPHEFLGARGPCPYCHELVLAPLEAPGAPRPKPEAAVSPLPSQLTRAGRIRERLRQKRIAKIDGSGLGLPQILGWGTLLLTLAAGGFAWAVHHYTVPAKAAPAPVAVPVDLTLRVLAEKHRLEDLRDQAIQQALASAESLVQRGSVGPLPVPMFSLQDNAVPAFEAGLFPELHVSDLHASNSVRKPGTEEFLLTVEPKDGGGPVMVWEQRDGQLQLHAQAFSQQLDETLTAFLETPGQGELTAYVQARPSKVQFPLNELQAWPKWDVQSAFPSAKPLAFIACAEPNGSLAAKLKTHRDTTLWLPLVLHLRWSQSSEGRPFIEMIETVPTAWGRF